MLMIFPTVHWTLCAEKALKSKELEHIVVPVPPHVNEGCGLGIKVDLILKDLVMQIFQQEQIPVEKILGGKC
ncbi:DUF3343 domain-containing protein [Desulfuribacillus alkaliarsenatis]|uniref:Putative Se/S carrier protein-like domain-containing protein n=1 Tax=Desulfuribacillus alkaliarsenatis TaxID=766136 RepID=A0A1E5FZH7_9FIRM|nr:DUF3343 domain-containing protein [Desulfuribacillus alkaliarsenatis]OEF95929.1 hypothetical protein BHF68_11100 [Desulfuribacillus alkaliarsenatis]